MPSKSTFTLTLPQPVFDRLTRISERMLCSRATVARLALLEWFQKHDPSDQTQIPPGSFCIPSEPPVRRRKIKAANNNLAQAS